MTGVMLDSIFLFNDLQTLPDHTFIDLTQYALDRKQFIYALEHISKKRVGELRIPPMDESDIRLLVFPFLGTLNLSGTNFSVGDIQRILNNNPRLTILSLENMNLSSQDVLELVRFIQANQSQLSLLGLNLNGNRVNDECIREIGRLANLLVLHLSHIHFSQSDISALSAFIRQNKQLEDLIVNGSQSGLSVPGFFADFQTAISDNNSIRHLDVSDANLSAAQAGALARGFKYSLVLAEPHIFSENTLGILARQSNASTLTLCCSIRSHATVESIIHHFTSQAHRAKLTQLILDFGNLPCSDLHGILQHLVTIHSLPFAIKIHASCPIEEPTIIESHNEILLNINRRLQTLHVKHLCKAEEPSVRLTATHIFTDHSLTMISTHINTNTERLTLSGIPTESIEHVVKWTIESFTKTASGNRLGTLTLALGDVSTIELAPLFTYVSQLKTVPFLLYIQCTTDIEGQASVNKINKKLKQCHRPVLMTIEEEHKNAADRGNPSSGTKLQTLALAGDACATTHAAVQQLLQKGDARLSSTKTNAAANLKSPTPPPPQVEYFLNALLKMGLSPTTETNSCTLATQSSRCRDQHVQYADQPASLRSQTRIEMVGRHGSPHP